MALLAVTLFPLTTCIAQESSIVTVKVRVETKPAPTKAVGLVFSTEGATQIGDTTIQKVGDKLYDVIFSVNKGELKEDSVATAMAISAGGDLTFANVTPALLSESQAQLANIPECPSEDTTNFAKVNQLAPLKALVDIRADRADLAQRKVIRALDEELLAKLRRLEEAFGIIHAEELSVNLPADELVDRFTRLNYALKQYQTFTSQKSSGIQTTSHSATTNNRTSNSGS
jgi:hypothetical protein